MKRFLLPVVVVLIVALGGPTLAADVFVEPMATAGLPDDAKPAFQTAIEQAFQKAKHKLVAKPIASGFQAKVSVAKERSRYDLTVDVVNRAGKKVIGKTAQCAPCTLDEAQKQLELLIRTVSLDLDAIAETLPPPAVPAVPPPPPSTASAPVLVDKAPKQKAPEQGYQSTGWYRAMLWTFILPSVAGVASAVKVGDRYQPRCDVTDCRKHPEYLVAGMTMLAVTETFGLFNLFDLAQPGRNSRIPSPWFGVATSVALGFSGYLLIKNDGYGSNAYKMLGFADLPLAALAAATSIGTLAVGAEKPVSEVATAFVGPGFGGLRVRF